LQTQIQTNFQAKSKEKRNMANYLNMKFLIFYLIVTIVLGSNKEEEMKEINLFKVKLNQAYKDSWIENLKGKTEKLFNLPTPPKNQEYKFLASSPTQEYKDQEMKTKFETKQESAKNWIKNLKENPDKIFNPPKDQEYKDKEMKIEFEMENFETTIQSPINPSNSLNKISEKNTHTNNKANLNQFSKLINKLYSPVSPAKDSKKEYEMFDNLHNYKKINDENIITDLNNNVFYTQETNNTCSNCLSKLKPHSTRITAALLFITFMMYIFYLIKIEH
jgi:hypothetical protein